MAADDLISAEARLIDNVSKVMNRIGANVVTQAKTMRDKFNNIGKSITSIRTLLIGAGMFLAFDKTVGAAGRFESQMREVATLSEEMTKNIGQFSKSVLDLSSKSGQGLDVLTKALYDATSAGVAAGDAMEFLEVSTRLAIGGATTTATAVDGLTTIINAFSLETSQALDVADAFFTAMKFGKTTVAELAANVGPLAPTAKAAGLQFDEMLGGLSALTKAGFNTTDAVTALQGALVGLNSFTPEAIEQMESMHLAWRVTGKEGETFIDIINNVTKAGGGTLEGVKALIPNIRGVKGVLGLANEEGKAYNEVMKLMGDRTGETAKAYAKMTDTFEFKSARVKASFNTAFIEAGNQIMPIMQELADNILENMDGIKKVVVFVGAAVTDVFSGWIMILNTLNLGWAKFMSWIDSTNLSLSKYAEKLHLVSWGQDQMLVMHKKAADSLKNLSQAQIDYNKSVEKGSAIERYMTGLDEAVSKVATSMKDMTDKEKSLIGATKELGDTAKKVAEEDLPKLPEGFLTDEQVKAIVMKNKQLRREMIDDAKALNEELRIEVMNDRDEELARLQAWYDEQKALLKEANQDMTNLDLARRQREAAINKKFDDADKKSSDEKINKDDQKRKALISNAAQTTTALTDSAQALSKALGADARQQKTMAMTMAIVHGALAIQKALSSAPPPWNFLQAAAVGVATAANVATIAQQKFAQGGLITRPTMALMGEAGTEAVLNPAATAAFGVGNVNALNTGQGMNRNITNEITYSPTIQFTGEPGMDILGLLREDKEEFARFFKKEIVERGFLG